MSPTRDDDEPMMLDEVARAAVAAPMDTFEAAVIRDGVAARMLGRTPSVGLGRFQIEKLLGRGGMGTVYRAVDSRLGRAVAIKLLRKMAMRGDDHERLMHEATMLAKLSHPNVVTVHEVGEHEGRLFLVMELAEGATLDAWLTDAPRTLEEILGVYAQAMAGLAAAHALGIVHRDFKPGNVVVGNDGRVRVLDFGLARAPAASTKSGPGTEDSEETYDPSPGGTPPYMAPEQAAGLVVGPRSDQFSLCVSIYESVLRVRPFSVQQLRAMGVDSSLAPVPQPGHADCPAWLRRILVRGLAASPERRWPSVAALAHAIESAPRRRKRAAWSVAALGTFVAVGWIGVASRPDPCPAPTAEMALTWNETRRARLLEAADRSQAGFAPDALRRVADRVDAWAERWIATRREACVATRVEGSQSDAMLDASVACLERRKRRLASAIGLLEAGEVHALASTSSIFEELGAPEDCRDSDASIRPRDPEIAAAAEALADLAGLQVVTGDLDAAAISAGQALDLAERADEPILRAQALIARGRVEHRANVHDDARVSWFAAVKIAESIGSDALAADCWCRLASLAAADLEDVELAREWLDRSEAAVARLGSPMPAVACHEQATALVLSASGDVEGAIAAQRRAVDAWARAPRPIPSRVDEAELVLANFMEDAGHVEDARARYLAMLEERRARLGQTHPDVARIEYDLARSYRSTGELKPAREHASAAVDALTALFGEDSQDVASALTVLAEIDLAEGNLDAAIERASRARAAQARLRHGEIARSSALTVLANAHLLANRRETALALYLELAQERTARVPEVRGAIEYNIGDLLCQLGRSREARSHYEWVLDHLAPDEFLGLAAKAGLARVAIEDGATQEAVVALEAIVPKLERLEPTPVEHVAEARWLLARALAARQEDPRRVVALVRSARATYVELGDREEVLASLDALEAGAASQLSPTGSN